MEITTSANLSPPGFKTFQQPCVGEFLFRQFQDCHHATTGHPIKTLSIVKGFQILLECVCVCFCLFLPLGVRWESAGSPLGVRWESAGSPLGPRWESAGSPVKVP